jgi:hypothetical protein
VMLSRSRLAMRARMREMADTTLNHAVRPSAARGSYDECPTRPEA